MTEPARRSDSAPTGAPWIAALSRAETGPWSGLRDPERAAQRAAGLARAAGWLGPEPGRGSCPPGGPVWVLPSQRGLDRAVPWLAELDPATARDYVRRLREACEAAGVGGGIVWPRIGGSSRRRGRALDPAELGVLRSRLDGTLAGSLVAWLSLTGARPGEARATRWRDLDVFEDGTGVWRVRGTKTAAARRALPLDSAHVGVLPSRGGPDELVWPLTDWEWRVAWSEAARATGLAGDAAVPYVLRHTFCTRALERGLTYEQVAAWLGHANGDTLRKHYRHAVAPVSGVGNLLSGAR